MKKIIYTSFGISLLLITMWKCGIIPKAIGKQTAIDYVNQHYEDMNLTFEHIEFSYAYDDYIVTFTSEDNQVYNFKLSSKYFPTNVVYDSVKQSHVYY